MSPACFSVPVSVAVILSISSNVSSKIASVPGLAWYRVRFAPRWSSQKMSGLSLSSQRDICLSRSTNISRRRREWLRSVWMAVASSRPRSHRGRVSSPPQASPHISPRRPRRRRAVASCSVVSLAFRPTVLVSNEESDFPMSFQTRVRTRPSPPPPRLSPLLSPTTPEGHGHKAATTAAGSEGDLRRQ